jgi:hypothetical protein
MSRMVQYEAENKGLGLTAMVDTLIKRTWKAPRRTGIEKLLQLQTEQVLLTYLLAVTVDDNASFQVKAIAQKSLNDLKIYIQAQQKTTKDTDYTAHLVYALKRMDAPKEAKPTVHKDIPPGAPIGCDED